MITSDNFVILERKKHTIKTENRKQPKQALIVTNDNKNLFRVNIFFSPNILKLTSIWF